MLLHDSFSDAFVPSQCPRALRVAVLSEGMEHAAIAASRENKTVDINSFWVSRRLCRAFTGMCCAAARRQDDLIGIGGECVGVELVAGRYVCVAWLVRGWRDGVDGDAEGPLRDVKHVHIRLSSVRGGVQVSIGIADIAIDALKTFHTLTDSTWGGLP
ncbi:hypothetical protein SVAN01_04888 [Stagonosporopsis vannaccii]|nr:hypothetical protein SVAN01_04888 [Stagonosporopsis vannaccii]